jgi:hypothetical protein
MAVAGCMLLGSMSLVGQDSSKPQINLKNSQARHAKAIRISGKVSDDGTRVVEDRNQKVWVIGNVDAMKGFEGQKAVLRGRTEPETNTIQVLSIQGLGTYSANSWDSAFRR